LVTVFARFIRNFASSGTGAFVISLSKQ